MEKYSIYGLDRLKYAVYTGYIRWEFTHLKRGGRTVNKKTQKSKPEANLNTKLVEYAATNAACSNYVKGGSLTENDVNKVVPAALRLVEFYGDSIKSLICTMYADSDVDHNGKTYNRVERVFSALVAQETGLSTSTVHEKLTESVNLANREVIRHFFSYTDTQLDSIRVLVYKFSI